MSTKQRKEIKPQKGGQEKFVRSNVDVAFFGGVLNPQPIDSLIATPNGFIKMGDAKVGDIVFDQNGNPQTINFVIDKGIQPCYEFILEDWSKVESAASHRWLVKNGYRETLDLSTEEVIETFYSSNPYKWVTIPKLKKTDEKNELAFLDIQSYNYIGEKHCKCINVSGEEHLYLTNNYIVTRNCGKSAGAVLSVAEYLRIPKFRGIFIRRNLDDQKRGGGLVSQFNSFYDKFITTTISESPRATTSVGSWVDFTHIADEKYEKVVERFKGAQYDFIYFDELTSFEFKTFTYLMTRNRGEAGIGGKFRATTNPKKSHWIRTWLDWYIDPDGFIYPERNGKVRYFYISGEDVASVVWGNSKQEVYNMCKVDIDTKLRKLNRNETGLKFTYQNFIKSFVFYEGNMAENTASLGSNMDYVGSVAASGGTTSQQLINGNWNVDEDTDPNNIPINNNVAKAAFMTDPQTNNDWYITTDLAAEGSDNLVAVVWNGFHVMDIKIINTSTPIQNAQHIVALAEKWNIPHSKIIFDATNGMYLKDYISEAKPFKSRNSATGLYKATYQYMKNECAYRFTEMMRLGLISFDTKIATKKYVHVKLKHESTIESEFVQECYVLRFREDKGGRKALYGKKEMNAMLGHGRSMDLLDCFIMRMRPILRLPIGSELTEYIEDVKPNAHIMEHGMIQKKDDIYTFFELL